MSDDTLASGPDATGDPTVTGSGPGTATGTVPPAGTPLGGPVTITERPLPAGGPASTWGVSLSGVRTVAVLETRQRVRSTRWFVVLLLWMSVLALLTILIRWAVHRVFAVPADELGAGSTTVSDLANQVAGRLTFGIIVFLVLSLAGLVAPALSATSVNGDRQAGVLATMQTTLLTPAEIVLGKLIAAWVTGLALLAGALPFLLWIYLDGGTPLGRLLVVVGVTALTLLVVCAIGLGWSAVTARTSSSAVLTYLTVAFLGPGLPLLFGLSVPLVQETREVPTRVQVTDTNGVALDPPRCNVLPQQQTLTFTDRSWWLLAASPYVVVADAAPKPITDASGDWLGGIRDLVRDVRLGPSLPVDQCFADDAFQASQDKQRADQRERLGATWPYGLAADVAVGALFTVVAVRRLRTPTRRLPQGTRVA